ncbi:MAG: porphobilinogen synthase [Candidatus Helarchaeota archaeon]
MKYPQTRLRRLRNTQLLRDIVAETKLQIEDFIYPLFISEKISHRQLIEAMPDQFQISLKDLSKIVNESSKLGVQAFLLFGIPAVKDAEGTSAFAENGIIQQAVRQLKAEFSSNVLLITDICMCEYTNHGHCGILKNSKVDNDLTLQYLEKIAISHARAGADFVAPSAMMDGQVRQIRRALDAEGFNNIGIMSYAAKFASNFYSPFRSAAESAPSFGDRKDYQMDFRNPHEALREVQLDLEEGADIIMVKPALAYLDILYRVKTEFQVPTAAYNVSGEYAMLYNAINQKIIPEAALLEILIAIKRAGADLIISYFTPQIAKILTER